MKLLIKTIIDDNSNNDIHNPIGFGSDRYQNNNNNNNNNNFIDLQVSALITANDNDYYNDSNSDICDGGVGSSSSVCSELNNNEINYGNSSSSNSNQINMNGGESGCNYFGNTNGDNYSCDSDDYENDDDEHARPPFVAAGRGEPAGLACG